MIAELYGPNTETRNTKKQTSLNKAEKKEIFYEIIECEDRAYKEAMKYYDPKCSSCVEFIEYDVRKLTEKETELMNKYWADLQREYNITREKLEELFSEGENKGWEKSDWPPDHLSCR